MSLNVIAELDKKEDTREELIIKMIEKHNKLVNERKANEVNVKSVNDNLMTSLRLLSLIIAEKHNVSISLVMKTGHTSVKVHAVGGSFLTDFGLSANSLLVCTKSDQLCGVMTSIDNKISKLVEHDQIRSLLKTYNPEACGVSIDTTNSYF